MQLKFSRNKKRIWILTLIYRLNKLCFFIGKKHKMRLFLNLEWIFYRLALEESSFLIKPEDHPRWKFTFQFLSQFIGTNTSVLDLGCKYGDLSNLIATIAKSVIAVDYDAGALLKAKNKYLQNNLTFVKSDALYFLENSNQKFDIIILSHIIEHLDKPEVLLRAAKTKARLIYIEVPDFDYSYMNHFRLLLGNKLVYSDNDHITEFNREGLKELISNVNLKIINEEFRHGVIKIICIAND